MAQAVAAHEGWWDLVAWVWATPTALLLVPDLPSHPVCPLECLACQVAWDRRVWDRRVWDRRVWDRRVWVRQVWGHRVWDRRVWDNRAWDNRAWDNRAWVCPECLE